MSSYEDLFLKQLGNIGSVKKEVTAPAEKFDIGSLITGLLFLMGNKGFQELLGGLFSSNQAGSTESIGYTPAGQQTTSWGELGFPT